MRIALLSTFYPFRGGIAQFGASLYRELEKKHEVAVFTFSRQYPNFLFPGDTQFVTENDNADAVSTIQLLDTINPLSYYKTAAEIRLYNPDLVITQFWMPFFAPSLGTVAKKIKKAGIPVISILHNIIPHEKRPGDNFWIKYFLKHHDGFVVLSKTVQLDLLKIIPHAKYVLKPHPIYEHFGESIDAEKSRKILGLPANKKLLLFFGFIRDYKGLDILIQSLPFLPDDYHLIIAGEVYGDFTKYQQLIDQYNLKNKISLFIKYINDGEVTNFFSAADVCVLPYKSATQSGITQIAFNFNLPVIATAVGGLSEMIEDGKTGLILDSQNPEILAEKINYYFDKKLKQSLSNNIKNKREEYSWFGFSQSVCDFFDTLKISRIRKI